jgi:PAS domain S-box-containing protein
MGRRNVEERLLLEIVRSLPVAMAVADYHDRSIFINEKFTNLLGFTIEDLPTVSEAWPVIYPDEQYRAQVIQNWTAAVEKVRIEGGEFTPQRYRVTRKDGTMREVEFRYKPLDGYYIVMAEDVTERQQAEAALRALEERFAKAFQASPDAISIVRIRDLKFIEVNDRWLELNKCVREDVVGRSVDELNFNLKPVVRDDMSRRLSAHGSLRDVEVEYQIRTGEWRVGLLSAEQIELEGEPCLLWIGQDITERKQAEAALRRSELLFRTLAESSQAAILLYQKDRFIYGNSAAVSITGYELEELRRISLWDLIHPDSQAGVKERMRARLRGEAVSSRHEIKIKTRQGGERWIDYSVGIAELDGRETAILTAFDITERYRTEMALRFTEAELRASREQLRNLAARLQTMREEDRASVAREIHDELGQALTGLKLELRWLSDLLDGSPTIARRKIASMLDLVGATINNMRRIATSLRPGILDDFGLVAALDWQAREFAARTGIPCLLVNTPGNGDDLPLDRDRATAVFRIFQESLTNVARHAEATNVTANLTRTNGTLILEVRDNGRGITTDELTNARSLGLIGMRERAQMFGGTFDIHGEPGVGTTVKVSMPLDPIQEAESHDKNPDR